MKRPPLGFTLVELLVVITIIGMLVGLLLPAINMARESGRSTTCENNLHQLSLAVRGHVDKLGFYPSDGWGKGSVGDPNKGTGVNQPGGWIYQVLPYMDLDNVHDQGKGSTTISNTASLAPLPVLYCPSRRSCQLYGGACRTDYAINGGSIVTSSSATCNGIACNYSHVTDVMIPDSKDTTYLIGEKFLSPENYITGVDNTQNKNDPGDVSSAMSGDDVCLSRWGNASLLPSMDRSSFNSPPANPSQIFGSAHGAGWHMAFCDGHVKLISWGLLGPVHQAMATRNGHEVVNQADIP